MCELNKLKWQCRRGVLELDLLLESYLETDYQFADDGERTRFAELLKLEDTELMKALVEKLKKRT
jgi:antitoxin CptB